MTKIDSKGMIAGGIVWLVLMAMMAVKMACIDVRSCGGGDFFMYGLLGIGFLAPSYFVAAVVSR
ncbi:MAG: hypothetical protein ABJR82_21180 [Marinobacter sp.]